MRRRISSQIPGSYTNRIISANYHALLALLLLFGMVIVSSSCARSDVQEESSPPVVHGETDIWFDDINADQMLSPVAGELIARYVTNRIFEGAGDEEALGTLLDDKALRIVFISLSDGNSTSKVFMGRGKGVIEAVEDALFELDALQQGAFLVKHVKIDIVQSAYNTSVADPRVSLDETYERDLFGLAFDHQTGLAYLPGEILGHTLIDSDRHLRFDNMADYAAISQKPVDEIQNLSSASDLDITRFSSISYYSDGEEIIGLYRNHRFFGQLDPKDLLSAAISGANYLKESVGPDGKFVYSYFPKSDTEKDDYNILRHAGTIYAMLEVYEYTQDPELLVSIEHAIEYLLTTAQTCGDGNEAATCIVEEGESKLGGNGLTIVALAKYTELTGNEEYYPLMTSLANWILSVQNDAGEFTVHKLDHETGVAADFTSDYYPGEALLALMRLYALDGDPTWLEAADKGAEWLITVRDGEAPDYPFSTLPSPPAGYTWNAMKEAAQTDPELQERVDLFLHRVPQELYNVREDPDGYDNLIDDPNHQEILDELRQMLANEMYMTDDDDNLSEFESLYGVTGEEIVTGCMDPQNELLCSHNQKLNLYWF